MKKKMHFLLMLTALCTIIAAFSITTLIPAISTASQKVRLSRTKVQLTQGQTYKLKVKGIKKAKLTYRSSSPSIASVTKSGKITAKKRGTAKITVTIKKGKKKYKRTCRVTVRQKKASTSTSKAPATQKPSSVQTPGAATNAPVSTAEAPSLIPTVSPATNAVTPVVPTATAAPTRTPRPRPSLPVDSPSFAPEIKKVGENNPLIPNSYTADPAVIEYNGRLYVYMSNDSQHYEKGEHKETNSYEYIQSLHIISTDDMVNWTDHGTFQIAAANTDDKFGTCQWAGCCWAPCATYKKINGKDQFFIYFTNGGYQIGVIQADSPVGPFHDPIDGPFVGPFSDNTTKTGALDPAVFTDDDGSSYLCYGGSNGGARIRKLADNMTSFSGKEVTIDAPYFFEDSGINKIGDTYYFSYCSDWKTRSDEYSDLGLCSIGYMTSKSPTGPYTYRGDVLANCGTVFKLSGNNHHSIIQFQGKYYMFYHTRVLEDALGSDLGFRSCHVNELFVNEDGSLVPVQQDLAGVSQIKDFNPYQINSGTTFSNCSGMLSTRYLEDGAYMQAVSDPENYEYAWSLVKGVEFGTESPASFTAHFKMETGKTAKIRIYEDSLHKRLIAEAEIKGDKDGNATVNTLVDEIQGKHDIYFAFKGDVLSFENWTFNK